MREAYYGMTEGCPARKRQAYLSVPMRNLYREVIRLARPVDVVFLDRNNAIDKGLDVGIRDFRVLTRGVLELKTAFGWIPAQAGDELVVRGSQMVQSLIPRWEL